MSKFEHEDRGEEDYDSENETYIQEDMISNSSDDDDRAIEEDEDEIGRVGSLPPKLLGVSANTPVVGANVGLFQPSSAHRSGVRSNGHPQFHHQHHSGQHPKMHRSHPPPTMENTSMSYAQTPNRPSPPVTVNTSMASSHKGGDHKASSSSASSTGGGGSASAGNNQLKSVVTTLGGHVDKTIQKARVPFQFKGSLKSFNQGAGNIIYIIDSSQAKALLAPDMSRNIDSALRDKNWTNVDYGHVVVLDITLESPQNSLSKNVGLIWESAEHLNNIPCFDLNNPKMLVTIPARTEWEGHGWKVYDSSEWLGSKFFEKFGHKNMEGILKHDVNLPKEAPLTRGGLKTASEVNRIALKNLRAIGIKEGTPSNDGYTYYAITDLIKILKKIEDSVLKHVHRLDIAGNGIKFKLVTADGSGWTDLAGVPGAADSRDIEFLRDNQGTVCGYLNISYVFPRKAQVIEKTTEFDPYVELARLLKSSQS